MRQETAQAIRTARARTDIWFSMDGIGNRCDLHGVGVDPDDEALVPAREIFLEHGSHARDEMPPASGELTQSSPPVPVLLGEKDALSRRLPWASRLLMVRLSLSASISNRSPA
jgi:hypothetical protein